MLQKNRYMEVQRHEHSKMTSKPNNTEQCKTVQGINTGLGIKYDSSCPHKCCFESYPCTYCGMSGCPSCSSAALEQQQEQNVGGCWQDSDCPSGQQCIHGLLNPGTCF